MATRACARSKSTSPTPWAGPPPPGEVQPWVYQQITQTFILDPEMRARLAKLNPTASAKVANRLLEASERKYWQPDEEMLAALASAGRRIGRSSGRHLRRGRRMTCNGPATAIRIAPRGRRWRGQRAGAPGSQPQDRQRQGVCRLRQGRHRQEHDLVESLGRLLQARQARAADRLRSQARLHLHAHQAPGAHRDRRARVGQFSLRRAAHRGFRLPRLQRRDVRRGRRTAGRHRLRRLCRRPDREAAQGAPPARGHRRGDLRCAGRCGMRRLRGAPCSMRIAP